MCYFLKGRMLWQYYASTIINLVEEAAEEDTIFITCVVEWDSHNHMILTWFQNTYFFLL